MSQAAPTGLTVELALAVALNEAAVEAGVDPLGAVRLVRVLQRRGLLRSLLDQAARHAPKPPRRKP